MITVPEATKKIVERSRYLSEAISKGLINYSSLARYIRPELEQMLVKKVSTASIIMALTRLEADFKPKYQQNTVFKTPPEISVRSNLFFFSVSNGDTAGLSLLLSREADSRSFFLKNQGVFESSFILSQDLHEKFKTTIESKNPILPPARVCAITIQIPLAALDTPGIYYFFLKSLAWEGINIVELISTPRELSLIVDNKHVEIAFSIIKSLF